LQRACGPETVRIEAGREAKRRPARKRDAERRPNRIPKRAQLAACGPAPIPRSTIVGGEEVPVKTSLRRAKNRRGLDRDFLPAKKTLTGKGEWELGHGVGLRESLRGALSRCSASMEAHVEARNLKFNP